jgi:hypothetical protein
MQMSDNTEKPIWVWLGGYLTLLLLPALLVMGLLSVSYYSAFALLIGFLVGILLLRLVRVFFPSVKALWLSIVALVSSWNWSALIRTLSIALILSLFVFLLVSSILITLGADDVVEEDFLIVFVVSLTLLLSVLVSVPVKKFLSLLVARARSRGWWGWVWIQRALTAFLLSVFLFPLISSLGILCFLLDIPVELIPCPPVGLLALLLGILLSWPVEVFVLSTSVPTPNQRWRKWVHKWRSLIVLIFSAAFPSLWVLFFLLMWWIAPRAQFPLVAEYHVLIEPVDPTMRSFKIAEEVVVFSYPSGMTLPYVERQIDSTNRGFLLREAHVVPLEADSSGYVDVTLTDGTSLKGSLCGDFCPQATVELRNFPKNSFYDAKNAEVEGRDTYIDIETITLSISDLEQSIVFAYVPPPYHYLRLALAPFVGLSSFGEFVVASLGLICAVIIIPIVRPALSDVVKERFKSRFKKRPQKKVGKKATLIISGKGEEKEVEIIE